MSNILVAEDLEDLIASTGVDALELPVEEEVAACELLDVLSENVADAPLAQQRVRLWVRCLHCVVHDIIAILQSLVAAGQVGSHLVCKYSTARRGDTRGASAFLGTKDALAKLHTATYAPVVPVV